MVAVRSDITPFGRMLVCDVPEAGKGNLRSNAKKQALTKRCAKEKLVD